MTSEQSSTVPGSGRDPIDRIHDRSEQSGVAPVALNAACREHQARMVAYVQDRLEVIIANELPKSIWAEVDRLFESIRDQGCSS